MNRRNIITHGIVFILIIFSGMPDFENVFGTVSVTPVIGNLDCINCPIDCGIPAVIRAWNVHLVGPDGVIENGEDAIQSLDIYLISPSEMPDEAPPLNYYAGKMLLHTDGHYEAVIHLAETGINRIVATATDIWDFRSQPVHIDVIQKCVFKKGDIDLSGRVDMADAIISLKVLAGLPLEWENRPDYEDTNADVNNNERIDLAEAVYALRKTADLR